MVLTLAQSYRRDLRKLGFKREKAEQLVLRAQLFDALVAELRRREWTQAEAAKKLGVKQPRISELNRGRLDKFTSDLLVKYLHRLGKEVTVQINDIE